MEKDTEKLNKSIKDLIIVIKKANSFKFVFLRGILWGIGSAVGATVIAVIIIAILSSFIQTVGDVPILGNIINNLQK